MTFQVQLTKDAARDLKEIWDYISHHDGPARASQVVDRIEKAFQRLSKYPQRGSYPKELLDIGVRDYREVFVKPHRIIYRVIGHTVYVLIMADGRRDMQTLLQRRLLQA